MVHSLATGGAIPKPDSLEMVHSWPPALPSCHNHAAAALGESHIPSRISKMVLSTVKIGPQGEYRTRLVVSDPKLDSHGSPASITAASRPGQPFAASFSALVLSRSSAATFRLALIQTWVVGGTGERSGVRQTTMALSSKAERYPLVGSVSVCYLGRYPNC